MGAPLNNNDPYIKSTGERSTIGAELANSGTQYTLPTASAETKGGVKIGAGLTMTGEVLSNSNPTPYSLPTAAADTLGGVKVGSGLSIDDGVLSATGGGGSVTYRAGRTSDFTMSKNNSWSKQVTFTNAMPNTDYAVVATLERTGGSAENMNAAITPPHIVNKTVNGFNIRGYNNSETDYTWCYVDWIAIAFNS